MLVYMNITPHEHHAALESLQRCAEYGYSGFPLKVSRADPHVLPQAASSGTSCQSEVYHGGYPAGVTTALAVPIKYLGQVRYVLSVGFLEAQVTFVESKIDALERYSARSWQAVASALRFDPDSEWHQHSALLNQLSTFMQTERDSEGAQHLMLHALLTGVTACFGLRFNRACVFLFEEADEILVHQLSIGQFDWSSWQQVCQLNRKRGLDDVTTYLAAATANALDTTELDNVMKDCRWQIGQHNDVVSRVFRTGRPYIVNGSEIPSPLRELLKSTADVAVVPLRWAAQSVGIMIADNEFSRCPITNPELETLCVFASTAAINLESLRLHRRRIEAEGRLRALLNTANTYERYGGVPVQREMEGERIPLV